MLFTRYNILIFRPNGEMLCSTRLRGWVLPFVFLFVSALAAGVYLLWPYQQSYYKAQTERREIEERIDAQYLPIYQTAFEILNLEKAYHRIRDLNTKLGVMLHLDDKESVYAPEEGGGLAFTANGGPAALNYPSLLRLTHRKYGQFLSAIRLEEVHQQRIIKEIILQKDGLTRIPSIWPTRGRLSSPFGYRKNPFTKRVQFHKAIDITAKTGTPIRAPASGTVTYAKWFSSYGNTIDIDHHNGLKTRYAHLSKILVQVGQKVERGEIIGSVGSTGRSVSPHLHYEVYRNGRAVNPMYYIMDN